MEIAEHLEGLQQAGEAMAEAGRRAGFDAPIPTCQGWQMRDLLQHMGDVHRWAAAHVAEQRTEPILKAAEVAGQLPEEGALLDWFCRGLDALVRTLQSADPSLQCWTFLPAPSSVAFWARRQAHETSIHRADAESAVDAITPFPSDFAADGIEELLFGFLGGSRSTGSALGTERTLHLHATDGAGEWLVRAGAQGLVTTREHAKADCSVRGTASDLYLLVWNRLGAEDLDVSGDPSVLEWWRETVQIHWSRGR